MHIQDKVSIYNNAGMQKLLNKLLWVKELAELLILGITQ